MLAFNVPFSSSSSGAQFMAPLIQVLPWQNKVWLRFGSGLRLGWTTQLRVEFGIQAGHSYRLVSVRCAVRVQLKLPCGWWLLRTSWKSASKVRAPLHQLTQLTRRQSQSFSVGSVLCGVNPGSCRKEHLAQPVAVCLEVGRDVRAGGEVSKPDEPWCVLTEVEECRTQENATV